MILLTPAIGVPHDELLQDTLKSGTVILCTLAAAFAFFWHTRDDLFTLKLHWLQALPTALLLYALGSMMWSHTYLGGIEAARWAFFSLILFLGLQAFTQRNVTLLVWCIHIGAVLASLWTALQFWMDWQFFAQGPNPASTFVNRNFFAEFLVCTLPYSVLLLTRVKDKTSVFLLAFSLIFNVVALMMTGTRSALFALLLLLLVLPSVAWMYRKQWASRAWGLGHRVALVLVMAATVLVLGSIPTNNRALVLESSGHSTAIDRALSRSASVVRSEEFATGSFSIRTKMWLATIRLIQANPLAGVGAGAWEVQIPKYQDAGTQLETDYYAHNEPLQLIAEYGLVGWGFLVVLVAYLLHAARRTLISRSQRGRNEALLRSMALSSLLALMVVSNAGFAWRMASTGVLFALSLAVLVASDIRMGLTSRWAMHKIAITPKVSVMVLCGLAVVTGPALYAIDQAIRCEAMLIGATKIALGIQASGVPNAPEWAEEKEVMLHLLYGGIAINPHYRKLTPIAADAMANWGDWGNAMRVWESVLASRPYVVIMLTNVARGYIAAGELAIAQEYLLRAQQIQPTAASVTALQEQLESVQSMKTNPSQSSDNSQRSP